MKKYIHIPTVSRDLFFKITLLKSMMYCGVLWGLYHQGWAITADQSENIFPFWLNSIQALHYARLHWPNYTPRKITPQNFESALIPLLNKFQVTPALYSASGSRMKLSTPQIRHFFFKQNYVFSPT